MNNYINKLYLKSNKDIKNLFSDFLTEENGEFFLDFQKIIPCPAALNGVKKKALEEKNKDLINIYKNNVCIYGYMDGESWKVANWGTIFNKIKCEFTNENKIITFNSDFLPIQGLSKIAEKLNIKNDICIDFIEKNKNKQGRYVFFSENPEENFYE